MGDQVPEKLTVDLHPIFRSDRDIDSAVRTVVFRAAREKVPLVEIIHGKGKGKLKARVLAMLAQPHLKKLYRRVEVPRDNDGVVLVHFGQQPQRPAAVATRRPPTPAVRARR
ncbi:Smr/MutS family protein [Actinosynnema sp. CA-299493]